MTAPTILVVEDNPTTRKMLRVTLQAEGYTVVDAHDASSALIRLQAQPPDLIVQDIGLPDMDGAELAKTIRATPQGQDVPIIAVSGFLHRIEEMAVGESAFSAFLAKPVERERLVGLIADFIVRPTFSEDRPGRGRRLVVADDEPVQRKLLRLQLETLGFDVTAVDSGEALLREARARVPDAIVTDVSMPHLDGFATCLEIRKDPALAHVPVLLISAYFTEDADREVGRAVGANSLVSRSQGWDDLSAALIAALTSPTPEPVDDVVELRRRYADRLPERLRTQVEATFHLSEINARQATQIAVLGAVANSLASNTDPGVAIESALAACLDAASLSRGAIYRKDGNGSLGLRHSVGLTATGGAATLFGHPHLLEQVVHSGQTLVLPSDLVERQDSDAILAAADISTGLLIPVASRGESIGVLFLGSSQPNMASAASVGFGRSLGAQLGQAMALKDSYERLAASERLYRERGEQLAESEREHRSVTESASDAIVSANASGAILSWNGAATRLFGYTSDEAIGENLTILIPERYRDDHIKGLERFRRTREARVIGRPVELVAKRKDGTEFPVELSLSSWESTGGPHFGAIMRDVTERKQQQLLEQQLLQAQRMESVGRLAGGVAHDFNNLLTVILSFAAFVRDELPHGDRRRDDIGEVLRAADSAANLTRQLLAFSRRQPIEPRVVDLNQLTRDVDKMLRRIIGEDIELVTRLGDDLWPVLIDPGQFEQVLVNLAVNARDAMPAGGRLVIEIRNSRLPDAEADEHVIVCVADTGIGMAPEVRRSLFEPFFTTKKKGRGTGLGLSMVLGLVEQAGGTISVESELGNGARFEIRLPRSVLPVSGVAETPRSDADLSGTETILIAEDERSVRAVAARILANHGYRVIATSCGAEALREFQRRGDDVDLLLTDVVMPEGSGNDLANTLKVARPDIRILFMTGYSDDTVARQGVLEPGITLLQKPFTEQGLLARVRAVLDATAPAARSDGSDSDP